MRKNVVAVFEYADRVHSGRLWRQRLEKSTEACQPVGCTEVVLNVLVRVDDRHGAAVTCLDALE
jgi:hypothetical protein